MTVNKHFRRVATLSTDLENHRTESSYNNSMILKRFIFEFLNYFLYLFYIGLYRLNITLLK